MDFLFHVNIDSLNMLHCRNDIYFFLRLSHWGLNKLPTSLQTTSLTPWGRVTHICINKLTIIGSNQFWNIVNWTLRNKLQWNFNRNSCIFIKKKASQNVVSKMAAIFYQPQCVKWIFLNEITVDETLLKSVYTPQWNLNHNTKFCQVYAFDRVISFLSLYF